MPKSHKIALALGFALVIVLQLFNLHNGFFWDTVHFGSAQPDYFYSNHFSNWLVPDEIDSGHIPGFAIYIALIWTICGRTLEASHLAMMPFAIGIVWQLYILCRRFIPAQFIGFALLLVLIDPTLLAQFTLVSPDVTLVFFFLLALNAILHNWKLWLCIGIFCLFGISLRGIILSFGLLLLDLYCNVSFREKVSNVWTALLKRSLIYLPALVLCIVYFYWHFSIKGWIGTHTESPWAKGHEAVDFEGFLLNVVLLIWRFVDFGRIAVWLVFSILLLKYRKMVFASKDNRLLVFFLIGLIALMSANMLWAKNLIGPRYLIPVYLVFALFCAKILFSDYVSKKLRGILLRVWLIVIISGNFWIYPPSIAQGWDASLAHLPYYELRHEAIAYLEKERVDFKKVQSFFPNYHSLDRIDLNGDQRDFDGYDGEAEYIFYSNVYNVPDALYDVITATYEPIKRFEKRGIYIVIYRKLNGSRQP